MRVLSLMSGFPVWGSSIGRRNPQSIWLWRPAGLGYRGSIELGKTKTPLLEEGSCTLDPGTLHRSLSQTYLWVLVGLLWRQASAVAHCGARTLAVEAPWNIHLPAFLEVTTLALRPGTTQLPDGSNTGTPQATQPTQPDPSADKLPKVVLSPRLPLNISLDIVLSTRGPRPTSTQQCAYISSIHQEANTSPWTNLTYQETEIRSKRSYKYVAWEMETTNT